MPEDLREQVQYWKNRRNDCAHFKDNEVTDAHVQAFWSFIKSNLALFVPNGSKESLLQEVLDFFDLTKTPRHANIVLLREKLEAAHRIDVPDVLRETLAKPTSVVPMDRRAELLSSLLRSGKGWVRAEAAKVAIDDRHMVATVRHLPSVVVDLALEPSQVRRLWNHLLFEGSQDDLPVLAALLRNGLVPTGQVEEAMRRAVEQGQGAVPRTGDVPVLEEHGYMEALKTHAFEEGRVDRFDWGNPNAELVRWYVETQPIDDVVFKALDSAFRGEPHPNTVRDALRELFSGNADKLNELQAAAVAAGELVPRYLDPSKKVGH